MSLLRILSHAANILTSKAMTVFDKAKVRLLIGGKNKKCYNLYYEIGCAIQKQRGGTEEMIRLKQEISRLEADLHSSKGERTQIEERLSNLNLQLKEAKGNSNNSMVRDLEERISPLKSRLKSTNRKISHLNGILKYNYVVLGQLTYHHRLPYRRLNRLYQEIDNLKREIAELQLELENRNNTRSIRQRDDWLELKERVKSILNHRPYLPHHEREITIEVASSQETEAHGRTCPFCLTAIHQQERVITCSRCETSHHEECWQANQGCSVFGCEGRM